MRLPLLIQLYYYRTQKCILPKPLVRVFLKLSVYGKLLRERKLESYIDAPKMMNDAAWPEDNGIVNRK